MFSQNQMIFAACFVIAFIAMTVYAYRKDLKLHQKHYKGSIYILFGFFVFIGILLIIKSIIKY